jgi:hypothetical protein
MDKRELLRILTTAYELEEGHTPTVTRFFLDDFDWNDLPKDRVDRVKDMLKTIQHQTAEHANILDNLIGEIQRKDGDEF